MYCQVSSVQKWWYTLGCLYLKVKIYQVTYLIFYLISKIPYNLPYICQVKRVKTTLLNEIFPFFNVCNVT